MGDSDIRAGFFPTPYLNVTDNKNETYNDLLQTNSEGTPRVGLDAMLNANDTLEYFVALHQNKSITSSVKATKLV